MEAEGAFLRIEEPIGQFIYREMPGGGLY